MKGLSVNHRYLGTFLGILACAPGGAVAQRLGTVDCNAAAEAMRGAQNHDQRLSAARRLSVCPDDLRVETHVAVLRGSRQLDREEAIAAAYLVTGLRDDRLLHEVILLAGDKTASVPARVVAFMALAAIKSPTSVPRYEGFAGGVDSRGIPLVQCAMITSHARSFSAGPVPFAADYLERINGVATRVRRDSTEPSEVRSAAACT
jgi:hypothetical protein